MRANRIYKNKRLWSVYILFPIGIIGCNKLAQVPNPISSVTTVQTFSNDANATSAILGIYSYMSQYPTFATLETSYFAGKSADELTDETGGNQFGDDFLVNNLTALNDGSTVLSYFWQPAYFDIYSANAIILGVQASSGITASDKSRLIGEAKFLRAYCYFYLTNLFGDLPLVLTTDFNQTVLLGKTPQAKIYQQIIADLLDAQDQMIGDFSLSSGQPIRANKWAATALLARVYLYEQNWVGADSAANAVINSGEFSLVPLPLVPGNGVAPSDSDVFEANSRESILQLQTLNEYPYATWEGNYFIPNDSTSSANCWLTSQLLGAFQANDLRRLNWVDSTDYNGVYYYYPYKYKVKGGDMSVGNITENYILLRLAEQYLIRAEAQANLGNLSGAINDVNTIRERAGLANLSNNLSQSQVLDSIQQEDRIEFFSEWGHRWLDLKRWGIAIQTLGTISYKQNVDSSQLLYPIPMSEIQDDPNLVQNPGYGNY